MTPEKINALLAKLDAGFIRPIATPPEFAEAAEVIRYLMYDRDWWIEDARCTP